MDSTSLKILIQHYLKSTQSDLYMNLMDSVSFADGGGASGEEGEDRTCCQQCGAGRRCGDARWGPEMAAAAG